ncbi:MAG: extracellular solute-binding protein, partial [Spirochaetales bacterium]|nr:extracellular solute-binding protein [Spirochaetales bacterium]
EAAMYIGGSWEINTLQKNSENPENIGFFAPPVLKYGDKVQLCFHVDIGIAMNKVTRYPEAAERYMKWVASEDYAQTIMEIFPGFFSYTPGTYDLQNPLVKDIQKIIGESEPTVRTLWEKLSAESPQGNQLLGEAMQAMYNKEMTPTDAANYINNGLSWYFK